MELEPTDEMCVFIRAQRALPNAQLRVAVNEKFAAVRPRASCAGAGACRRAPAGRPEGEGAGVPMQGLGYKLSDSQLRRAREKCDPAPTWSQDDDSTVKRLMIAGTSADEIARRLSEVHDGSSSFTAKRVAVRWHNVLKPATEKVVLKKDTAPPAAAATLRWTMQETVDVAEWSAILCAASLYDVHREQGGCTDAAHWHKLKELLDSGRSAAAVMTRFNNFIRPNRPCRSAGCSHLAAFGSLYCPEHVPVYSINNQLALASCAAAAEDNADIALPLRHSPQGYDAAARADTDVIAVAKQLDDWLRRHHRTATSLGTFVHVDVPPMAGGSADAASPPATTLDTIFPHLKAGTKESFHTNAVNMMNVKGVPMILVAKYEGSHVFVAVFPQPQDQAGKVSNYLLADARVLSPVEAGLNAAVRELSAHCRGPFALFGFKLREAFRQADGVKCGPARITRACSGCRVLLLQRIARWKMRIIPAHEPYAPC